MKFHLIYLTDPSLLLHCKSINDLITCPNISTLSDYSQQQQIIFHPPSYSYSSATQSMHRIGELDHQLISTNFHQENNVIIYEECSVILQLPQAIRDKQSKKINRL